MAADYLVMAAWLAYLKSRLLLPRDKEDPDTTSAEEMALTIAVPLERLGRDAQCGCPVDDAQAAGSRCVRARHAGTVKTTRDTTYTAEIYDLLKAYADQRRRTVRVVHVVKARKFWSIKDARVRLEKLIGASAGDWTQLDMFIEQYLPKGEEERTAIASSFGATLEMAREGLLEIRQDEPFAPIYMRKRAPGAAWERVG